MHVRFLVLGNNYGEVVYLNGYLLLIIANYQFLLS